MFTIRLTILWILVFGVLVYAWRDWFIGLLGLIVLSSIMNHPDMPRQWFNITGLNIWNIMFLGVAVPWYVQRGQTLLDGWDVPPWMRRLYFTYLGVVFIAVMRAIVDRHNFPYSGFTYSPIGLINDYVLNAAKYTFPGLMLLDGARTRQRIILGLIATMTVPLVFSIIISRHIRPHALGLSYNQQLRVRRHVGKTIGFHANTCSQVLAASAWGALGLGLLRTRAVQVVPVLAHAGYITWGLILCLSRAGYYGFSLVGVFFAVFLWRKLLIILPAGVFVICLAVPAIPQRLVAGFNVIDDSGALTTDLSVVTAGRTDKVWPPVLEAISGNLIFGYGRLGILRSDAFDAIKEAMHEPPDHPHNAYLELLLDTGIVGFIPVMALFGTIFYVAFTLARDQRDVVYQAVGCAALAAVIALGFMSVSGQSLFPKEASQVQWCTYGLAARVYLIRQRVDYRRMMLAKLRRAAAIARARQMPTAAAPT